MRLVPLAPVLVVCLAACSSGSRTAAQQPSDVVTSAAATTAAATTTSAGELPICAVADVAVRVTARDQVVGSGIAATDEGTVVITSTTSHACGTVGTPRLTLLGDDGKPLQVSMTAATDQPASPPVQTVVLQPGGQASFAFQRPTSQQGAGVTCVHVSDGLVALPGSADSVRSGISFTGCDTGHGLPLVVGPIVAGPSATLS